MLRTTSEAKISVCRLAVSVVRYRGVGRCFEMGGAGAKRPKAARKRGGPGALPRKFLENGPPNLSFWVVSRRMKQDQGL